MQDNYVKKINKILDKLFSGIVQVYQAKIHPILVKTVLPIFTVTISPLFKKMIVPLIKKHFEPHWHSNIQPTLRRADYLLNELVSEQHYKFIRWGNSNRIIFLSVISLLMITIGILVYIVPLNKQIQTTKIKINGISKSIRTLSIEERNFLADISENPNKSLQQEITTYTDKIAGEAEKITTYTKEQIDTPRLVQIIKSRISQNDNFKLLRVASLSPYRVTPLTLGATKVGLDKVPAIFVRPIEFDFEGNYVDTYSFLKDMEESWRIYWDSIEYLVTKYPIARVAVRIHLFSLSEDFDEI